MLVLYEPLNKAHLSLKGRNKFPNGVLLRGFHCKWSDKVGVGHSLLCPAPLIFQSWPCHEYVLNEMSDTLIGQHFFVCAKEDKGYEG